MRSDGSGKRNLTRHGAATETYLAAWSPAGGAIAYLRRPNRDVFVNELRVMNVRSGTSRRVRLPARIGNPRWVSW